MKGTSYFFICQREIIYKLNDDRGDRPEVLNAINVDVTFCDRYWTIHDVYLSEYTQEANVLVISYDLIRCHNCEPTRQISYSLIFILHFLPH